MTQISTNDIVTRQCRCFKLAKLSRPFTVWQVTAVSILQGRVISLKRDLVRHPGGGGGVVVFNVTSRGFESRLPVSYLMETFPAQSSSLSDA